MEADQFPSDAPSTSEPTELGSAAGAQHSDSLVGLRLPQPRHSDKILSPHFGDPYEDDRHWVRRIVEIAIRGPGNAMFFRLVALLLVCAFIYWMVRHG
jgi:hypothetical protein